MALSDLLYGQYYTKPQVKTLSGVGVGATLAGAKLRRKKLLETAIAQGKLNPAQLGTNDASILSGLARTSESSAAVTDLKTKLPWLSDKPKTGVGGFLSNLGGDIEGAVKGFLPGLYTLGKSAVQDIASPGDVIHGRVREKVVDPVVEGYKQTYGQGNILKNLYAHPLQPILDVATIASLGGTAAAKAGIAPELISRTGRAPLVHPTTGREIPREYTPRVISKLAQKGLDRLIKVGPEENYLGRLSRGSAMRKEARHVEALKQGKLYEAKKRAIEEFVPTFSKLSRDESRALAYMHLGLNDPQLIDLYEGIVHDETLSDADKMEALKNRQIQPEIITAATQTSPVVKQLITEPSETMLEADRIWREDVQQGLKDIEIDPEQHAAHVQAFRQMLLDRGEFVEGPFYHSTGIADWWGGGTAHHGVVYGSPSWREEFHAGTKKAAEDRQRATTEDYSQRILELYGKDLPKIAHRDEPLPDTDTAANQLDRTYREMSNGSLERSLETMRNGMANREENATRLREATTDPAILDLMPDLRNLPEDFSYQTWLTSSMTKLADMVDNGTISAGDRGILVAFQDEFARWHYTNEALEKKLAKVQQVQDLLDQGYEGFAYTNSVEDPGSTSYFMFDRQKFQEGRPEKPIGQEYFPIREAVGSGHLEEPQGISSKLGRIRAVRQERKAREKLDRAYTAQTMFAPNKPRYAYASSGETALTGSFRTDWKVYLEHRLERDKQLIETHFAQKQIHDIAVKDDEGKLSRFKTQRDVDSAFPRGTMILVNDTYPLQWIYKEHDFMQKIDSAIETHIKNGGDPELANMDLRDMLSSITDADARAFVEANWQVLKKPGVAIPREHFDYQRKLMSSDEAYNSPAARTYAKLMHQWRTMVLTYMPRWALNTAVGSFLLAMVHNVGANDIRLGAKLQRSFITPEGKVITQPSMIEQKLLGQQPLEVPKGSQPMLPQGARLEHQVDVESLSAAATGYGHGAAMSYSKALGIEMPTRKLMNAVANIENYFRQAMFVHNARREARLAQGETPEVPPENVYQEGETPAEADSIPDVLQDTSTILKDHYDEVLKKFGGNVAEALTNPKVVDRAVRETNKMSYNYEVMGPWERRVLRQFVPFWGWYKFISQLAYKLPVEHPGRALMVSTLGKIGANEEEKYGPMPDWIRGSIPLSFLGGKLKYIPTMGLNPFAGIANPLGPRGALGGSLGVGQGAPVLQALMSAYGLDPLTMDRVRISPQEGVGQDFFGNWMDVSRGQQVAPFQKGSFRRFIMGLARAVPEVRLGEKFLMGQKGVGSIYPESVPIVGERPMGPGSSSIGALAAAYGGINLKEYDLLKYQQDLRKRLEYAQRLNRSQNKRLSRKFANAQR